MKVAVVPLPLRATGDPAAPSTVNVTGLVRLRAVVILAVNVTDCPNTDGFRLLLSVVAVSALLTVSVAAVVVAEPTALVKTARNFQPDW